MKKMSFRLKYFQHDKTLSHYAKKDSRVSQLTTFQIFLKTCITKQVNKKNKDKTNMKILRAYLQLMSIYTKSKI